MNKLTASEVLVQVKKLVDSGKWDKKKREEVSFFFLAPVFLLCIYRWVGWVGGYLRAYSLPCCLRMHRRRERQRGRTIDS